MPFVRGHRRSRTQSEIDPLAACGVTLPPPPTSLSNKDVVAVASSSPHNFDSFRTCLPSSTPHHKTPSFRNTICVPAVSVSLKVIPGLATIAEPHPVIDTKSAAAAVAEMTKSSPKAAAPALLDNHDDENQSNADSCLNGKDALHDEKLRSFRFPAASISFTSTNVETTSSSNVIPLSESTPTFSSIIFPTASIKATNLVNSEIPSIGGEDVNLSAEFSSDHGTTQVRDVARLTEQRSSRDREESDGNDDDDGDDDVNTLSAGESPPPSPLRQQQPILNTIAEKRHQSIFKNNDSFSIHESSLVNDQGNKFIVSNNLITKLEMLVPEASPPPSSLVSANHHSKINNNDETADAAATSLSRLPTHPAEKNKAKTSELSADTPPPPRQEKKTGILLMVEKSLKRRLSNAASASMTTNVRTATMVLGGDGSSSPQILHRQASSEHRKPHTPVSCKFPPPSYGSGGGGGFGLSNNYWAAARSPSIIA